MTSNLRFIFCIAAMLAILTGRTHAAERSDFRVNTDGGLTHQTHPRIAVAIDGSFVITWVDKRLGSSDIFLQKFDTDGYPVGTNQLVNDDNASAYQNQPAIDVDNRSNWLLIWKDYRTHGYPFNPDVFGQPYNSQLVKTSINTNLTTEFPDTTRETPDIALAEWGGGVVVWADYRNINWDIYGQLINSAGVPVGSNFRVNSDAGTAQQHSPRVSTSPEGWFVVTWYDNRRDSDDIYVQLFDKTGSPMGDNTRVNDDNGTTRQAFPDVATDGAGNFTVVWVDWRNGTYPTNPDIYARKYDTTLTPVTRNLLINTDGTMAAQREPAISADRLGNVAIVWADSTAETSFDIMGQMIDVDGKVRELNFLANDSGFGMQVQPDVALDGTSRYLTWVDKRNGNFDIYASIQSYNEPKLVASPSVLQFEQRWLEPVAQSQTVDLNHAGYNSLSYEILNLPGWLSATPFTGNTPQTITFSINPNSLDTGLHVASLRLIDVTNSDSSASMSISLNVFLPDTVTADTITVLPAYVEVGRTGVSPIQVNLVSEASSLILPLKYDPLMIAGDSIVFPNDLISMVSLESVLHPLSGEFVITALPNAPDTTLPLGVWSPIEFHFTAGNDAGSVSIDLISNDTLTATLYAPSGRALTPVVVAGEVIIDVSTGIEDYVSLPSSFNLSQNFPNPFNLSTIIEFELAVRSEVRLELFNILGQRVVTLVSAEIPAGRHSTAWDGRLETGREAPSGIYFYRLIAGANSMVYKMVLAK